MQRPMLKELPRFECLLAASKQFPDLDPTACEAFLHLIRAGEDVQRVLHGHFAAHSITQGRFMVLMLLLEKIGIDECHHPSTPAEIADNASVSRATITGLLDGLERDGFINRTPDAEDRRQVVIRLTPAGQEFLESMLPAHFRLITSLMADLSENERKTLVRLLNKVVSTVDRLNTTPLTA